MPESGAGTAIISSQARSAYDYLVVTIHARHNEPLQESLSERGRDGWELVFMAMPIANEYQCVFRRPAC